jgi:hypothetical protein
MLVNGKTINPPVKVIPKTDTSFTAEMHEINHVEEKKVVTRKKNFNCGGEE